MARSQSSKAGREDSPILSQTSDDCRKIRNAFQEGLYLHGALSNILRWPMILNKLNNSPVQVKM